MPSSTQQRRQQILDPETVNRLIQRSNFAGLCRIIQQILALIVMGFIFWETSGVVAWLAGFGYCLLLVFCFCPLHESIHASVFASPGMNKLVGFVCGLILILPPRFFNGFHMAHHKYTQIAERDPELLTPKPTTIRQYLWYVSGTPYLIAQITGLTRHALGKTALYIPDNRVRAVVNEARLFCLIYLGIIVWTAVTGNLLFLWVWFVPFLIGQPFLRMFLLAEHTGCPEVADMIANTRTTLTNPLLRWLFWNMNYHTAHHSYAGIPFFRLPEANRLLSGKLQHVSNGYLRFNADLIGSLVRTGQTETRPRS